MNSSDILLRVIDTYLRAYRIMGYDPDTPEGNLEFRLARLRVDMHVLLMSHCHKILALKRRKKELEDILEWIQT